MVRLRRRKSPARDPDFLLLPLTQGDQSVVPDWLCILPAGVVKSRKGEFLVDDQSAGEILTHFNERGLEVVFDYEHQTLTGDQAPASGWIDRLEWRGAEGLWGHVDWTAKAREYLANKEYRYHSPVVMVRRGEGADNRAFRLHSVALTNTPAIDGIDPIVNKMGDSPEEETELEMLEWLRQILGLPADATWEDVQRVISNLAARDKDTVSANKEIRGLLELPETAQVEDIKGKLIALKDRTGFVPADQHNQVVAELAALKAGDLVEQALKAGKIIPAQKAWAEQYALKDPAGFKAFIDQAVSVVPQGDLGGGGAPKRASGATDAEQLSVNKMLGVSEEDWKKYGGDKQ